MAPRSDGTRDMWTGPGTEAPTLCPHASICVHTCDYLVHPTPRLSKCRQAPGMEETKCCRPSVHTIHV